jgi:hypothetical protein
MAVDFSQSLYFYRVIRLRVRTFLQAIAILCSIFPQADRAFRFADAIDRYRDTAVRWHSLGIDIHGITTEPRRAVEVPVRVFGTDCDGKPFSENLTTVDVSLHGTKLRGLKAKLQVDEIIGLTYAKNKAHFRVKWIGTPGTATDGVLGLLNLTPSKPLWDFPLFQSEPETFDKKPVNERRRWPRVKCSVSVELHAPGQPMIWGKASDIGQGGCFVEMAIPLAKDARFDIALWLGESKLHLQGQIASVQPGFGNGVRFLGLTSEHQEHLRRFIETITPPEPPEMALAKSSGS